MTSNDVVRSFRLPAPCISLDNVLLQRNVLTCTFKTAASSSQSSSLQSQSSPPPHTETMSAAELTAHPPAGLSCARCGSSLLSLESPSSVSASAAGERDYTPLPSEHWAELIEAWMCHAPETLTTDIVHRYGTDGFKPNHERQVLVGHHYLVLQPPKTHPQGWNQVDNVSLHLPSALFFSFSVLFRAASSLYRRRED